MGNTNEEFKKKQSQDLAELAEKKKREEEFLKVAEEYGLAESKREFVKKCGYSSEGRGAYYYEEKSRIIRLSHAALREHMIAKGISGNEEISKVFSAIRVSRNLSRAYKLLAGMPKGFHYDDRGNLFVVENSPPQIIPVKGDWSMIDAYLRAISDDPENPLQYPTHLALIKGQLMRQAEFQTTGRVTLQTQGVAIVGDRGLGKTHAYLKYILKPLFLTDVNGGKIDKNYFIGKNQRFNGGIEKYPLVYLDDAFKRDKLSKVERQSIGEKIKEISAGDSIAVEAKFENTQAVNAPFFALMIMNPEDDSISSIPEMGEDNGKLVALRFKQYHPMPDGFGDEDKFSAVLKSQLPAFMHYLLYEFEVPKEIKDSRYTCKSYWHPEVEQIVKKLTPEGGLLELIDQLVARDGASCLIYGKEMSGEEMSATELWGKISLLKDGKQFQSICPNATKLGKMLTALGKTEPRVIVRKIGNNPQSSRSMYKIMPPNDE